MAGDQPTVIIAKTIKGKGFSEVENSPTGTASRSRRTWPTGRSPSSAACATWWSAARARSRPSRARRWSTRARCRSSPAPRRSRADRPEYKVGEKVATRKAYGDALVALGARDPKVVALDGEVSNSTYADEFARAYPERYFEMFIAEQQMVAAATGLAVRGYKAFASTFAAFLTRAYDFIRMGAISGVDLRLVGSHAGVEIGADGPSQMALEDLAMMRAVHGSTVLYPADGTSTAALVAAMADTPGISYMRTTRGSYPGLYADGEEFPVGGSKVLRSGPDDQVTLVGAGVTLHECLRAADHAGGRRHRRPRHRLLLGQAGRRGDPGGRRRRRPAGGSSSPRTTTPRAASARRSPTPCSPPGSATCASPGSPSAGCPAPAPASELLAWAGIDAGAHRRRRPPAHQDPVVPRQSQPLPFGMRNSCLIPNGGGCYG